MEKLHDERGCSQNWLHTGKKRFGSDKIFQIKKAWQLGKDHPSPRQPTSGPRPGTAKPKSRHFLAKNVTQLLHNSPPSQQRHI